MKKHPIGGDSLGGDVTNMLFLRPLRRDGGDRLDQADRLAKRARVAACVVALAAVLALVVVLIGLLNGAAAAPIDVVPASTEAGFTVPFHPGVDDPVALCLARGGIALIYTEGTAEAWCEVAS